MLCCSVFLCFSSLSSFHFISFRFICITKYTVFSLISYYSILLMGQVSEQRKMYYLHMFMAKCVRVCVRDKEPSDWSCSEHILFVLLCSTSLLFVCDFIAIHSTCRHFDWTLKIYSFSRKENIFHTIKNENSNQPLFKIFIFLIFLLLLWTSGNDKSIENSICPTL